MPFINKTHITDEERAELAAGRRRREARLRPVAGHGEVLEELRVDGARVTAIAHAPGLAIHGHTHAMPKLAVLLAGGATERIGLEVVEYRAGELIARARDSVHENQYHAAGARSLVVELDALAERPLPQAGVHGARLVEAFRARRSERARLVGRAIADTVDALQAAPPPRTPSWLARVRELLFARIASPPRVAELAAEVGIHPAHLAAAFLRHFRTTPIGYVRAHRVFRAVALIDRGVPLASVSAEVGFADQSHMTRAIKRARQAPPGALRALAP